MRRLNRNDLSIGLLVAGLLFCGATVQAEDHTSLSPNKQWEYQCSADGSTVGIVKADTTESVLELSLDGGEKAAEVSNVVWAPDSNRFAFNHWDGYKASGTDLYQLRLGKWVQLSSTGDEVQPFFDRALAAEQVKQHVSKKAVVRSVADTGKVSQWTDADTAVLREVQTFEFPRDLVALGFVFTLKFDADGNWKVVKSKQMSKEEALNQ